MMEIRDGVEIHDMRGTVPSPRGGRGMREWSEIRGVMLHRTACVLGEDPDRWKPLNAHIGITLDGRIMLPHPWELMIWHGHGPSPWTIGIEIDGNPEGFPGYYWHEGKGPHPITDAQVRAGEVLLEMLITAFTAHGRHLERIVAHRQADASRESDPGWECWQKIALPWMALTGATPGATAIHRGDTWGSGHQIPREWDPQSTARFWPAV